MLFLILHSMVVTIECSIKNSIFTFYTMEWKGSSSTSRSTRPGQWAIVVTAEAARKDWLTEGDKFQKTQTDTRRNGRVCGPLGERGASERRASCGRHDTTSWTLECVTGDGSRLCVDHKIIFTVCMLAAGERRGHGARGGGCADNAEPPTSGLCA